MSIIALSGKMQSGKNTAAYIIQYLIDKNKIGYNNKDTEEDFNNYIKNKHYLKCIHQQKAFADKLKDIVRILINCSREDLENQKFKEKKLWYFNNLSPRELLQKIGTGLFRDQLYENIWVDALFNDYKPITDIKVSNSYSDKRLQEEAKLLYPSWLVTDLRFKNEFNKVKEFNGITIRINRDNCVKMNHISETDLDDMEFD